MACRTKLPPCSLQAAKNRLRTLQCPLDSLLYRNPGVCVCQNTSAGIRQQNVPTARESSTPQEGADIRAVRACVLADKAPCLQRSQLGAGFDTAELIVSLPLSTYLARNSCHLVEDFPSKVLHAEEAADRMVAARAWSLGTSTKAVGACCRGRSRALGQSDPHQLFMLHPQASARSESDLGRGQEKVSPSGGRPGGCRRRR